MFPFVAVSVAASATTSRVTIPSVVGVIKAVYIRPPLVLFDFTAVSYTHLTLPTNREV